MLKKQVEFSIKLKHNILYMMEFFQEVWTIVNHNIVAKILSIWLIAFLLKYLASLVSNLISNFLMRSLPKNTENKKYIHTVSAILRTTIMIVIWLVAIIMTVHAFGVNLAPLLTSAGILGAVIGFGAQSLIQDIIAGMFILIEHQYRVGDLVTLRPDGKEVTGTVEYITLRATKLRDLSGKHYIVRNSSSQTVINHTFKYAKINLNISVDYDSDIDLVEKVVNEIGQKIGRNPEYMDDILEPIRFLRIKEFADSGIIIKIVGKVKAGKQFTIGGQLKKMIKKEFDKNNIVMPYPHMVISKK